MDEFEVCPFAPGQRIRFLKDGRSQVVIFLALGPRLGMIAGQDTVTVPPRTAMVQDERGNVLTVQLSQLKHIENS